MWLNFWSLTRQRVVAKKTTAFWLFFLNTIAILLALIIYQFGGRDHFGERGFITFISTFQLLATAWLVDKIFQIKKTTINPSAKSRLKLWRIIAWGFIFLAADEFLSLHEVTDLFIHDLFKLEESGFSDRLDDLIVALYGVFSIWLLWFYRDEFKHHRSAIALFKKGFALLFVMVGIDLLANEQDILDIFFAPETANTFQQSLEHVEDSLKIFAEVFLILAFHSIWRTLKMRSTPLVGLQKASEYEVSQPKY